MNRSLCTALMISIGISLSLPAWAAGPNLPNGKPFQGLEDRLDAVDAELGTIQGDLAGLDAKLDEILAGLGGTEPMVPFLVMDTTGGVCNSAAKNSSNPEIHINSDGEFDHFVVTSVLVKTAAPGVPLTGFFALSINSVRINGVLFDTRTGNLVGATDGTGVLESADLMGTPIRRSHFSGGQEPGGNFPHQIVAENFGFNDIVIRLFCRSDDEDLNFAAVAAAGWKRPGDTITVTLVPGS